MLILNCGIVIGYILTSYINYTTVPFIVIGLPIIYIILMFYLPDTPKYLLHKNQENEAEISLKFYKNYIGNTKDEFRLFNQEFVNLKKSVTGNNNNSNGLKSYNYKVSDLNMV